MRNRKEHDVIFDLLKKLWVLFVMLFWDYGTRMTMTLVMAGSRLLSVKRVILKCCFECR